MRARAHQRLEVSGHSHGYQPHDDSSGFRCWWVSWAKLGGKLVVGGVPFFAIGFLFSRLGGGGVKGEGWMDGGRVIRR